jgi:uncharacterized protein YerC
MKKQAHTLSDKEKMFTLDALYTAASSLHGRTAMKTFLRDLLTPSERLMLGRRIIIARMLMSGYTYRNIAERLGMGIDTVHRIQKLLYDQVPGYEQAVKGIDIEMEKRRRRKIYTDESWKGSLARLKQKYPLHFLLVPWPKDHRPKKEIYPPKRKGAQKLI